MDRKPRATTEQAVAPESAPGRRRRPAGKKAKRGSTQSSSAQSSVPEDADADEGSSSFSDPSQDTAAGGTERTSGAGEAAGEEHPGPSPSRGEDPSGHEEEDGSTRPPTVREPNPLERFVEEGCIVSLERASPARNLYIAYIRWCDENRIHPWRQQNFGLGLAGLGFCRRRRGQGRH